MRPRGRSVSRTKSRPASCAAAVRFCNPGHRLGPPPKGLFSASVPCRLRSGSWPCSTNAQRGLLRRRQLRLGLLRFAVAKSAQSARIVDAPSGAASADACPGLRRYLAVAALTRAIASVRGRRPCIPRLRRRSPNWRRRQVHPRDCHLAKPRSAIATVVSQVGRRLETPTSHPQMPLL